MIDKKDGPADKPGESQSPKRPHATLDLKATEVRETTPKGAETPPQKSAPAAAASTAASDAAGSASAKTPEAAAGAKSASDAAAAAKADAAKSTPKASEPSKPSLSATKPAPAASSPGARPGAIFTHLVSGVAGGALAIAAMSVMGPPDNRAAETKQIGIKTAALEERLQALEKVGPSDPGLVAQLSSKLADAEGRVAKLEESGAAIGTLTDAQARLAEETKALSEKVADNGATEEDRQRISALEERLKLISAAAEAEPDGGRIPQLAAITGKITDIEQAMANQLAALRKSVSDDVDGRIVKATEAAETAKSGTERLDKDLTGLRTEAARLGQRVETLKADTDRLTAASTAVQEETATLASSLGQIKASVDAQLKSAAKPADVSAAVFPVASKLASLEQSLAGVVKSEDDRKANAERIILSLELANLKRAIDGGRSYTAELAEVRKVSGGRVDLTVLEQYKDKGVPTQADLEREFRPVMNAVIDADTEPADGSVVDRLIAGAKSVVRVRRVSHNAEDQSAEAVVSRMNTALKDGQLGDVVEFSEQVPERAAGPLSGWLEKLNARVAVDLAIASIEGQLKAALGGAPATQDPVKPAGKDRN